MTTPADTDPPAEPPGPAQVLTRDQNDSGKSTLATDPASTGHDGALRGTPIRDYDPDLNAEDYAAIARVRDEIRARTATGQHARPRPSPPRPRDPRTTGQNRETKEQDQ